MGVYATFDVLVIVVGWLVVYFFFAGSLFFSSKFGSADSTVLLGSGVFLEEVV